MHFLVFASIIKGEFYVIIYVIKIFMKKIFIQFGERIVKHRKRLIYLALTLFIGQICFFGINWIWGQIQVLAADGQTQEEKVNEKFAEWQGTMSFLNKACNVFIYPMLVVAWNLADNSFVYGEVFKFDIVLWQLWNIVKNLANFTLWFIFLFYIFKYLITQDSKHGPKWLIIRALIAWIWIQASWFVMAALIDVSTILTYGVWWLPISVLEQSDEKDADNLESNPYIMKTIVSVDAKDIDTMNNYLTNTSVWDKASGEFYISECKTFNYKGKSGSGSNGVELILAPKMVYYQFSSWHYVPTDSNRCHYYGNIYYFSSLYTADGSNLEEFRNGNVFKNKDNSWDSTQNSYKAALKSATVTIGNLSWEAVVWLIKNGVVLQIWDSHTKWWVWWGLWTGVYNSGQQRWMDKYNKWTAGEWGQKNTGRLQNILDGNSYVGVFTALYASLVTSKEWRITDQEWFFALVLNAGLELWFTLAIAIPLIVIAIIFMMRIGVLRLAIVLSPFIVLCAAFSEIWDKILKSSKLLENLKLENLIPIIFSPAIICFAISMCTVLISFIQQHNEDLSGLKDMEEQSFLGWLVVLNVGSFAIPLAKVIISVLGVAITWFLAWAAIETSKLWKSGIVKSLKEMVSSWLWSIPIIPVPTRDGKMNLVWTRAVFGGGNTKNAVSRFADKLVTKNEAETEKAFSQLYGDNNDEDKKKLQLNAYKKGVKNIQDWGNWTSVPVTIWQDGNTENKTFNDFEADEQAQIIDEINAMKLKTPLQNIPGYKVEKIETEEKKGEEGKNKDGKWSPKEVIYKYVKESESNWQPNWQPNWQQ